MKDYYALLGLPRNSAAVEIKTAYRKLSMKFHPDKNSGEIYFSDMFRQINEAYETLSDINARRLYDVKLIEFENPEKRAQKLYSDAQSRLQEQLFREKLRLKAEAKRELEVERQRMIAENMQPNVVYVAKPPQRNATTVTVKSESNELHESVNWWQGLRTILFIVNLVLGCALYYSHSKTDNKTSLYTARVNSRNGLRLRLTPSITAETVTRIPYYETVYVLRTDGPYESIKNRSEHWHQVKFNDKVGWLWGGYLDRL